MKSEKITKALVDRLPPRGGEYTIWDTELRGFGLRVHQSNRKVYILKYRTEGGRQRKFTLGKHGDLTPDMARRRAFELLHSVRQGENPAQERRDYRNGLTVEELAREYHERVEGTKSARTILDEKSRLRKTILPGMAIRLQMLSGSYSQPGPDGLKFWAQLGMSLTLRDASGRNLLIELNSDEAS